MILYCTIRGRAMRVYGTMRWRAMRVYGIMRWRAMRQYSTMRGRAIMVSGIMGKGHEGVWHHGGGCLAP